MNNSGILFGQYNSVKSTVIVNNVDGNEYEVLVESPLGAVKNNTKVMVGYNDLLKEWQIISAEV